LTGALVFAFPPFGIHVFRHCDAIVRHEAKIAGVCGVVIIKSSGVGERWCRGRCWRHRVCWWWRGGIITVIVVESVLLVAVSICRCWAGDVHVAHGGRELRSGRGCGLGGALAISCIGWKLAQDSAQLLGGDDGAVGEELEFLCIDV
jgi:hypothetical protein